MIKRCECLRYLCLTANRKNESRYFFYDDDLYPIESVFPLEDFEVETGRLIVRIIIIFIVEFLSIERMIE